MSLAGILNFFMPMSLAQVNPNCDYYQRVVLGQSYYIYNSEYPSNYIPPVACRWLAESDPGTKMVVTCEDINLPNVQNCQNGRVAISLSGDGDFRDAKNYCGKGSITLVSQANLLAVGLFAPYNVAGGRFICTLTSIQTDPPPTTTERPSACDCGIKDMTRIVGGEETRVNEFPSMAGLIDAGKRDLFCGASIISEFYALTAAHCRRNRDLSQLGLLVGDHNISTGAETNSSVLYVLASYVINPNYDSNGELNDIAVVKTRDRIRFGPKVGPVCLPFRYSADDFVGATVTALGWGTEDFSGPKADALQKVKLSVVSNVDCAAKIPDPISNNQMCTYTPGKDTCLADSGGPLLWYDSSSRRLQLLGVVSYGVGCATAGVPSVNTKVGAYLSWIISVTSDAVYCIK